MLKNRTPLVVAQLINNAGIVGAALAASEAGEDESPPRRRRRWCWTERHAESDFAAGPHPIGDRIRAVAAVIRSSPAMLAVTLEQSLSGRTTVLEFGSTAPDSYGCPLARTGTDCQSRRLVDAKGHQWQAQQPPPARPRPDGRIPPRVR